MAQDLPDAGVYLYPMRVILGGLLLLLLGAAPLQAQTFDFAATEALKVPEPTAVLIRQYIKKQDGVDLYLFNGKYAAVPVFNVLQRSQKQFVDGLYFFTWGAHDSGRLLIHRKGKVTFLANASTVAILADYAAFLKQNPLPETAQITYLGAIAAFMKYRYASQQELVKSGALEEPK
jgi:hypothetical protein